jgi:hypothetical protein
MRFDRKILFLALSLSVLALNGTANAELAAEVYQRWQGEAPEQLRIEVLCVQTCSRPFPNFTDVTVTVCARVKVVERSATHLRPDRVIWIRYRRQEYKTLIAGPRQVPLLEAGQTYPAYLEKDGEGPCFHPAAGGASFQTIRARNERTRERSSRERTTMRTLFEESCLSSEITAGRLR